MLPGVFSGLLTGGNIEPDNEDEMNGYLHQFDGKRVVIRIDEEIKLGDKQKMYNYYYKAIVPATIEALRHDGWTGIDEVAADEYLKSACAKKIVVNEKTNQEMSVLLDKRKMGKERLSKFITDCLFLLEERHNTRVMGSEEFKVQQQYGAGARKL